MDTSILLNLLRSQLTMNRRSNVINGHINPESNIIPLHFTATSNISESPPIEIETLTETDSETQRDRTQEAEAEIISDNALMPLAIQGLISILESASNRNELFDTYISSVNDRTTPFKKVLSDEGENELRTVKFKEISESALNKECPIFKTEFNENQLVTQLPCKHCFEPDAIKQWLVNEKAECPVCRYSLPSKEVRDNTVSNDSVHHPVFEERTETSAPPEVSTLPEQNIQYEELDPEDNSLHIINMFSPRWGSDGNRNIGSTRNITTTRNRDTTRNTTINRQISVTLEEIENEQLRLAILASLDN